MTYPHEQALLPEQVATRLQICRESVLRMLRSGELRGVKVLSSWRIPESAVDEFLSGGASK